MASPALSLSVRPDWQFDATYRASPAALTLAMTSTDAAQTQALVVSLSRP